MADNRNILLDRGEPAMSEFPRLANGFDVRSLASVGLEASEVTIGLASRQADSHLPETHKDHGSPFEGYRSIIERVRGLRNTAVGRWALEVAMVGTAIAGVTACGNDAPERPAAAVAEAGEGGGGAAQAPGGGTGGETGRNIIGDPACYEGFGKLSAAEQAICDEAFNDLSLEQATSLSSLDQARWAFTYRQHVTGTKSSALPERLTWESVLNPPDPKKDIALRSMTATALQNRSADVAQLAWLMQQQPEVGNDPRTWAALFGIGTTADSMAVADAREFAKKYAADNATAEQYTSFAMTRGQLFKGTPQNVTATKEKDGQYTVSFQATHATRGQVTLSYSYFTYLALEKDPQGGTKFNEFVPDDAIEKARGAPLIGVPNA